MTAESAFGVSVPARTRIQDPATKAKSVMLTKEGVERSMGTFEKHFMTDQKALGSPSALVLAANALDSTAT